MIGKMRSWLPTGRRTNRAFYATVLRLLGQYPSSSSFQGIAWREGFNFIDASKS
jgi:hypothetical protein